MEYRALVYFEDLQDNRFAYNPGDVFPREGLIVSKKRVKELLSDKNLRGSAVIEEVRQEKKEEKEND